MITLYDITIGDFPVSQKFGDHPENYNWIKDINGNPIKGHNGLDLATPSGSILLNPFPKDNNVVVSFVGVDPNGYGNFIRIWDKTQKCVILYGHCMTINIQQGDQLVFQQQVAVTDNTGWSSGPHCHVGFYMVDDQGNRLNRPNGFDGYLNVIDSALVQWTILNPTVPAQVKPEDQYIKIKAGDHTKLVTNSDNFQRVIDYLKLGKRADETNSDEVIGIIKTIESKIPAPKEEAKPTAEPKPTEPTSPPTTAPEVTPQDQQAESLKSDLYNLYLVVKKLLIIKW